MYNAGIIGCGRWGPNLLRNFYSSHQTKVLWVCDSDPVRLAGIQEQYPHLTAGADAAELLDRHPVDVLIVATPVSTHSDLVMLGLQHGCHVFVEKPLAATSADCLSLIEESFKRGRLLFVDYTYLFHPDIHLIKNYIAEGRLGERLLYYTSMRVNWGPVRRDVSAIGDLAVHDLAILSYICPQRPKAITAQGIAHVSGEPINQAFLSCFYPDDFQARIAVNWYAPRKIRRIMIGGSRRTIEYDELNPMHQIQVYSTPLPENSTSLHDVDTSRPETNLWIPERSRQEPLRLAVEAFYACLDDPDKALFNHNVSLEIASILEASSKSLEQQGRQISLEETRAAQQEQMARILASARP